MKQLPEIPTIAQSVWAVALECATRRHDHSCRACFDSESCYTCPYYLRNYAENASESTIRMAIMQADTEAYTERYKAKLKWIIGFIFFIVISLVVWRSCSLETKRRQLNPPQNTAYNSLDRLVTTLDRTAVALDKGQDMNKDGKVNCIDAAVLFYKFYPDKSNVRIIMNQNPETGMSHLFNSIQVKGAWRAVEPQTQWHNYSNMVMWDMDAYWGDKYNSKYDVDVTDEWKVYAK